MKDLDEHGKLCEQAFGIISGYMLYELHRISVLAGSEWEADKPETMNIIVNKENAEAIYSYCKEIRSGYDIGLGKAGMKKIKQARLDAHLFLMQEANDPNTSIKRKIELVKLTSTGKNI